MKGTMKRVLLLMIAAVLLSAGHKGYTVTGECGKMNGTARLSYNRPDGTRFFDETILKNGKFTFKGETPDVYEAQVSLTSDGEDPIHVQFYLENTRIRMKINPDKFVDNWGRFAEVSVTGGRSNEFMNAVNKAKEEVGRRPEFRELVAVQEEFYSIGRDKAAREAKRAEMSAKFKDVFPEYSKAVAEAIKQVIPQFPDAEAAAHYYNLYAGRLSTEEFEEGFNQFTEKVRDSDLAFFARLNIEMRKSTDPGVEVPDFTLNDPDGKPVTLSQYRGKYVIVNLSSRLCRDENKSILKELYARYHDKGLEILSVSYDDDQDAWKKALEEDPTPWVHVYYGSLKNLFHSKCLWGVSFIPSNFLVDKDGKMIGRLNDEGLKAILAKRLD